MARTLINADQIVGTAGAPAASEVVKLDASADIASGIRSVTGSANAYFVDIQATGVFLGNGSKLTGITADTVDVTASSDNASMKVVFAQLQGTSGVGLGSDTGLVYNPSSNNLSASGQFQAFKLILGEGQNIGTALDSDLLTLSANNLNIAGTVSSSGYTDVGGKSFLRIGGTAVDAVAGELNFVAGVTAGTAIASKAVVLDASKNIATINALTASGILASSASVGGAGYTKLGAGLVQAKVAGMGLYRNTGALSPKSWGNETKLSSSLTWTGTGTAYPTASLSATPLGAATNRAEAGKNLMVFLNGILQRSGAVGTNVANARDYWMPSDTSVAFNFSDIDSNDVIKLIYVQQ